MTKDKKLIQQFKKSLKDVKAGKIIKEPRKCRFCNKKFISNSYKSKIGRQIVKVAQIYCSKKCEKAVNKAIKKCFNNKKLTLKEKKAVKDLRYVDIRLK